MFKNERLALLVFLCETKRGSLAARLQLNTQPYLIYKLPTNK